MTIFLTGASGYVGRHVALELVGRGHRVHGLARGPSERTDYSEEVEWCFAELANFSEYRGILESCDTVVHCAMEYSEAGAENSDLDTRFITYMSRAGVPFVYTGNLFAERSDNHTFLAETLEPPPANWRFENERLVLNSPIESAVVRLGFVYGGKGGYLWEILSAGTVFDLDLGIIPEAFWPMVHVHDVASLYASVVEAKATGVFHAHDGVSISASDVIRAARSAYLDSGVTGSESHDYAMSLVQTSVTTTIQRSSSLGWRPQYYNFSTHAARSLLEYRAV